MKRGYTEMQGLGGAIFGKYRKVDNELLDLEQVRCYV